MYSGLLITGVTVFYPCTYVSRTSLYAVGPAIKINIFDDCIG